MNTPDIENINVTSFAPMPTPAELHAKLPLSESAFDTVSRGREALRNIIDRKDQRLFVVVGPCSIHDVAAAEDYARRLKSLADELAPTLMIVMRAYFEKPRTTVGWKGLVNDPFLNDTFHIEEGIRIARRLLLRIAEIGVPLSTEALDPISPQYLQELIAWSAIGARTTESQTHREMASGLSSAVGFKNGTDGSLDVAINALQSVSKPHRFLGINQAGQVSIIHTRGNHAAHVVLRGGHAGPNYDRDSVAACEQALATAGLTSNIMIDCSHANSGKDPLCQIAVARDAASQIESGNRSIMGLMIESNIHAGNQKLTKDPSQLRYGVSVTDACIDWTTTTALLRELSTRLRGVLPRRPRSGANADAA